MDFNLILLTMGVAFVIAVIAGPLFIPLLRRLKFGQQIREDGPQGHMKKAGTPTMGGVIILLALSIAFLRFGNVANPEFLILIIAALGFGLVGFLDDYIKIVFKRSLGLTARQKLLGQFLVAGIICYLLYTMQHPTTIYFPIVQWTWEFGWFYYPIILVLMVGISNAVNLTDGLDGLLSGTAAVAFGAYTVIALMMTELDSAVFAAAMVGAVLGFLVFNAHPAKVFMGDTGSLGIGGALAAVAILTKTEVLLFLIGAIFIAEVLSVMIQVVSFKTTGKRVFRMSPLHHHFELVGWSEWRVVITFWLVGLICAGLGIIIHKGL